MIFNVIYDRVGKIILSENDHIVEIVLKLLFEVFSDSWSYNDISEWIIYLLPRILIISANNVPNSELARQLLNKCANNMFYCETIITLLDCLNPKRMDVTENAFVTLKCLIQNAESTQLINLDWENIFEKIDELFTTHYEYVVTFFGILVGKFTREELFHILNNVDDDLIPNILDLLGFQHKDKVEFSKFRGGDN